VNPSLVVRELSAGYGGFAVLAQVSLEVRAGGLTALVGANGAGKTTLLKALAGVVPSAGTIRWDGVDIAAEATCRRVARGMVLVPEGRHLFGRMTVRENLELGGYLRAKTERAELIDAVLGRFPRLGERQRQPAGTLSGGEQQMLAIARALCGRPTLLMLDEPSLGLAPRVVAELFRIVREICAAGTSVLLVEQNVRQALAIADYAYVLERGRLVAEGSGKKLASSDLVQKAYLGADMTTPR